jgi:hypothetical protein
MPYLETLRSEFANVVLHGIGPTFWDSRDKVVGEPLGIEDVLIPSGTRLMMMLTAPISQLAYTTAANPAPLFGPTQA